MSDTDLIQRLTAAFLPFARGFAEVAPAVTLTVKCSPQQVRATLRYARDDFEKITSGSFTDVNIDAAFRAVASWNDGREPVLLIEEAP